MFAIRRILAAVFMVVALVSCDDDDADGPVSESIFPDILKQEREACEADNGRWGTAANGVLFVCYRNQPDANQFCSTESDCAGFCLARSRTCSPIDPFFGCHQVLSKDGLPQTVCVE